MTLAEGTSFLGHEGLSNTLYLRDCYPGLHKELNELFEEEDSHRKRKKNRAVAIIGNPGEKGYPSLSPSMESGCVS